MTFLNKMYGKVPQFDKKTDKNPNRVAGGLRAQGVDHFIMIAEDGSEKEIPSQRYVQSLEERILMQQQEIKKLQRLNSRILSEMQNLKINIVNLKNR